MAHDHENAVNRETARERFERGQDAMRHVPEAHEPDAPLPAGDANAAYPLNEQASEDFNVGGVERTLPPAEQLEQLVSYMDSTYPLPDFTPPWKGGAGDPDAADRYVANLPDRITHAAMLMLGSGLDHTMPGVAYGMDVDTRDVVIGPKKVPARVFVPAGESVPTGRWAISLHSGGWWRGSGVALEHQWRPEVAAAAQLSGTTILDLDHPLAPDADLDEIVASIEAAVDYVRGESPRSVALWGYSSGGALAALAADKVDALVLTFPDLGSVDKLPDALRAGRSVPAPAEWPRTLLQLALNDEIAARPDTTSAEGTESAEGAVEVREYHSTHRIATPAENRRRVREAAEFLASVEPR